MSDHLGLGYGGAKITFIRSPKEQFAYNKAKAVHDAAAAAKRQTALVKTRAYAAKAHQSHLNREHADNQNGPGSTGGRGNPYHDKHTGEFTHKF